MPRIGLTHRHFEYEYIIDPNELKVAKHSVLLIVDGAVIFTA